MRTTTPVLKNLQIVVKKGLKSAFVWPGQGGQFVGMIDHLTHLKWYSKVMHIAKEALGDENDIEKLMREGPQEELDLTMNTGPAMLIASYLTFQKLVEEQNVKVTDFQFGFGYSLGELTTAAIAEWFELSELIKFSRDRSVIMQKYWPQGLGKMIACVSSAEIMQEYLWKYEDSIKDIDRLKSHILQISGINSYTSTSLTGHALKVDDFAKFLETQDKNLMIALIPISVAGHCDLMKEASVEHQELLRNLTIKDPLIPIVSWIDWRPIFTKEQLIKSLVDSFWSPVNFRGWVNFCINENIEQFIELSVRGSMTKFIKNIQMRR